MQKAIKSQHHVKNMHFDQKEQLAFNSISVYI